MTEIVKINASEYGLPENKAAEIAAQFTPMLDKMVELESEYNEVLSLDINDPKTAAKAKEVRLKYVKVRTGTAEIHKAQKDFYLKGGRFVDGWKNAQLFASQGIEENLEKIETHFQRMEAERKAKLKEERTIALLPYCEFMPTGLDTMDETVFAVYLAGQIEAHKLKIEAEAKAKADAEAAAKAESDRLEAQRLENIRLKAEAEKMAAAQEAERKAAAEALRIEQEARHKAEMEAQAKADAARKEAEEKAAKERKEAESKLKAEQEQRAKIEAEIQAKKDAEAKAEADRIAAEKKAAKAPDKEKLIVFAKAVSELKCPEMSTPEGMRTQVEIQQKIQGFAQWILTQSSQM